MKLKSKLILISLALLFFGLASSALAATCGRVDSNGDYWYQCDGVQITQVAQTMWGDAITNFTNSDTDASWDFYDGLNDTTTSYLSAIPIIFYQTVGTVDIPEEWLGEKTINITVPGTYNFTISSTGDSCYNFPFIRLYKYDSTNTEEEIVKIGACDSCGEPYGFRRYNNWDYQYSYTFPSAGTYKLKYHSEQRYNRGGSDTCTKVDYVNTIFTFNSPLVVPQGQAVSLTANPSTVDYNGSSTLSWSSTDVISCSAPWTTSTSTSGAKILSNLTSTQDYPIQCTNKGTSRWDHSSVLYNGKIYSWGGRAGEMPNFGLILNTLDIYDIASNLWSTGKTGGAPRENHSSVLYNGKIYSWGGWNLSNLNTLDIYDIATNSWSTGKAGGTIRGDHTSVLYNGKIYSWGGWDLHMGSYVNTLNTLDIYDIATNSWSTGKAGGARRYGHSSVLYNGKIYSWGGWNLSNLNTLDIYDIATNSWSTGKAGGTIRGDHTSVLYNGKIYFWGGYGGNGEGVLNTVDIYDIATNSWSTGAAGGTARFNHSSILYEDKMYSLWGANGSPLNTLDVYNITSNSWLATSKPETTVYANTTITVKIPQPPTASINSSAPVTNVGDKTLLTWSSTNANSCYAIGGWGKGIGTLPASGSTTTSPVILGMNYFSISCTGSGGTTYATSTVEGKSYLLESNCPQNQEWIDEGSYYVAGHFVTPGLNECFCGDDTYSCACGNDNINCYPDTYDCECGDAYCEYGVDSMNCECGDGGCIDPNYTYDCACGNEDYYCWDSMDCACGNEIYIPEEWGYCCEDLVPDTMDCACGNDYEDCYDDGWDWYCDYYPDTMDCSCGNEYWEPYECLCSMEYYEPDTYDCSCGEYCEYIPDTMDCECPSVGGCWDDSMNCPCGDSQDICYEDTFACLCNNDYCEYVPDTYNCTCGDSYSCLCEDGDTYWVDGMVEYVGYCQDINSNIPIVSLITQTTNVYHGDKFPLTYSTDNFNTGDTCTLSGEYGWTGTVLTSPASEIEVGPIPITTTFGIICSGDNGSDSDYKTINLLDGGIYSDSDGSVVCEAKQTNPEHKIYVNKNTTWSMSIPTNIDLTGYTLSTAWSGDGIQKTTISTSTANIYTTVGLKRLHATTTATKSGSGTYRFICSTSTNVILGNDIIQEI